MLTSYNKIIKIRVGKLNSIFQLMSHTYPDLYNNFCAVLLFSFFLISVALFVSYVSFNFCFILNQVVKIRMLNEEQKLCSYSNILIKKYYAIIKLLLGSWQRLIFYWHSATWCLSNQHHICWALVDLVITNKNKKRWIKWKTQRNSTRCAWKHVSRGLELDAYVRK